MKAKKNKTIAIAAIVFLVICVLHLFLLPDDFPSELLLYAHLVFIFLSGLALVVFWLGLRKFPAYVGYVMMGLIFVKLALIKIILSQVQNQHEISKENLFLLFLPYLFYLSFLTFIIAQKLNALNGLTKSSK